MKLNEINEIKINFKSSEQKKKVSQSRFVKTVLIFIMRNIFKLIAMY